MGGFSTSMSSWWARAPPWLEVRVIELPGYGWRAEEPLPFTEGSSSEVRSTTGESVAAKVTVEAADALATLSFIESPFPSRRQYESYLKMPQSARVVALDKALHGQKSNCHGAT